eukprot:GFUD01120628.1.p1 GENE.GFUD01120628.1~~GFUD01120628.1.p1  ORF type:complete len:755 (-),score=146.20 GFUD01120628.1:34-2277(-)
MVRIKLLFLIIITILKVSNSQNCLNEGFDQQYQRDLCYAFTAIDLRVVGGAGINVTEAPWHTIITGQASGVLKAVNVLGGGNLITTRLVLTAAHLFWSNSRNRQVCPKEVRELKSARACHDLENGCPGGCHRVPQTSIELFFGVTDIRYDQPKAYTVAGLHLHPGYNKVSLTNDLSDGHDLAILMTNLPVKLSPTVQPICLPHPSLDKDIGIPEQDVSINGFGRDGKSRAAVVENLQQGCLYIVDKLECRKSFEPVVEKAPYIFKDGKWNGDQICAQGAGVDSCQGDSGGGIVANIDNTNIIIGVTSFGSTSCRSNIPGMYTNIMSHIDWIQQIMENESILYTTENKNDNGEGRFDTEGVSGDEADVSERLIVLGGWVGDVSQSNTVFMESCPVLGSEIPDLPQNISHGVGTIVKSGNGSRSSVVFCGGIQADIGPTDDCFEFDLSETAFDVREAAFSTPGKWNSIPSLGTKRGNAAISYLPSMGAAWITGGRKATRIVLDSTEMLAKQGNGKWEVTEGPVLSQPVGGHCAVTVSSSEYTDTVFIIGGASFDSKKRTFVRTGRVESYRFGLFGLETKATYDSLQTPRSAHACTLMTGKSGKDMIFVAGGQRATKDILDSVEYITLDDDVSFKWIEGVPLPRALTGASLITKMGLPILIGGAGYKTDNSDIGLRKVEGLVFSNELFAYNEDENVWKKTGEVTESVAYHVTLALENDICLEMKKELRRDTRGSETNTDEWNADNFVDIR